MFFRLKQCPNLLANWDIAIYKLNPLEGRLFHALSGGLMLSATSWLSRNIEAMRCLTIAEGDAKGVPLTLHAHQFIHAKASHWLENGMNIAQISYLLGHECIQTTMIYLEITTVQESI